MSAVIHLELDQEELKKLVKKHFEEILRITLDPDDIKIETKSRQNYHSEWESGAGFRATVNRRLDDD